MNKKVLPFIIQFVLGFLILFLFNHFLFKNKHAITTAFFGALLGVLFTFLFNRIFKKKKN
jgi:positive regulator of sigma E activity